MSSESITRWMTAIGVCLTAAIAIIGFIAGFINLPTRAYIDEIAKRSVQKINTIVISERRNPESAWDHVYLDSINEASHKGYIEQSHDRWVTSKNHRDSNRLLTEEEMEAIKQIVASNPRKATKLLTHSSWVTLRSNGLLKMEFSTAARKEIVLLDYEKIGIISGYIEEVKGG